MAANTTLFGSYELKFTHSESQVTAYLYSGIRDLGKCSLDPRVLPVQNWTYEALARSEHTVALQIINQFLESHGIPLTDEKVAQSPTPLRSQEKVQERWAKRLSPVPQSSHAIHTLTSRLEEKALPRPPLYHLFLKDHQGTVYTLVKDNRSATDKSILLYDDQERLGYTTSATPASRMPKETFIDPSSRGTYKGRRNYPKAAASSYPEGVSTYYIIVDGKEICFDRGHGIPHADHIEGQERSSTYDAENYAPQNFGYNRYIRRPLEAKLRKEGLRYKEIAIYHSNSSYTVSEKKRRKGSGKQYNIPIPEGFLVLVFEKSEETAKSGKKVKASYYFPNFTDYVSLRKARGDETYTPLREHYKIEDLSDWLPVPEVTIGEVDEHQNKVLDALEYSQTVLIDSSTRFFANFTEESMPNKARAALLMSFLEWNMEAAASLEFKNIENQVRYIHFYLSSRRKIWEFDSRSAKERVQAIDTFLEDRSVSATAQRVVTFWKEHEPHLGFKTLQMNVQSILSEVKEVQKFAPASVLPDIVPLMRNPEQWETAKEEKVKGIKKEQYPEFFEKVRAQLVTQQGRPEISDEEVKLEIFNRWIKGRLQRAASFIQRCTLTCPKCPDTSLEVNLAEICVADVPKLEKIIGGVENYDEARVRHILSIVDARVRESPSTVVDKLYIMRLYHDYIPDKDKHARIERDLMEQVKNSVDITLLELRQIADYYSYRGLEEQKREGLERLLVATKKNPTPQNLAKVAEWCFNLSGAFLQEMKEKWDKYPLAKTVAFQVFKALSYAYPFLYEELYQTPLCKMQKEMGFYDDDHYRRLPPYSFDLSIIDPYLVRDERGVLNATATFCQQFLELVTEEIKVGWLDRLLSDSKEIPTDSLSLEEYARIGEVCFGGNSKTMMYPWNKGKWDVPSPFHLIALTIFKSLTELRPELFKVRFEKPIQLISEKLGVNQEILNKTSPLIFPKELLPLTQSGNSEETKIAEDFSKAWFELMLPFL